MPIQIDQNVLINCLVSLVSGESLANPNAVLLNPFFQQSKHLLFNHSNPFYNILLPSSILLFLQVYSVNLNIFVLNFISYIHISSTHLPPPPVPLLSMFISCSLPPPTSSILPPFSTLLYNFPPSLRLTFLNFLKAYSITSLLLLHFLSIHQA